MPYRIPLTLHSFEEKRKTLARLKRRELKTDELETRMNAVKDFFASHQKKIVLGGVAALLGVGMVLGVLYYIRRQQANASQAFSDAIETYHGVVMESPPEGLPIPSFKTGEEKFTKAREQFIEVSQRYSRYLPGRLARYYAALSLRDLGKLEEAETELSAIAREKDEERASLAKMALAGIYRQTGRMEQAEKQYRELEEDPTATVPKATVQIALADLFRETRPQQALELYRQIEQEYPGTAAGDLAAARLREME